MPSAVRRRGRRLAAVDGRPDLRVREPGEVVVGDGASLLERQRLERRPELGVGLSGQRVLRRRLGEVVGR